LIIPKLENVENEMKSKGIDYKITESGSWSYNRRNIRWGNTLSYHALWIAVDVNPWKNPMKSSPLKQWESKEDIWKYKWIDFDVPKELVDAMIKQWFRWWWYWTSPFDPMHFEFWDEDYLAQAKQDNSDYKMVA
jgi:hypothetical protein